MKLFRFITTVQGFAESFTDWYDGETEAEARKLWEADCKEHGLPESGVSVTVAECDRKTLNPI